jgi:uncharacterized surface protein with fasciclin (FAS1) repeats
MTYPRIALSLLALTTAILVGTPTWADNKDIEEAMQNRTDISLFKDALVKTGVVDELKDNRQYTVFVPSNSAFTQVFHNPDACYQVRTCKEAAAAIVRDHIVPMKASVDALYASFVGVPTLGDQQLQVEQVNQRQSIYRVDGHSILRVHEGTVSVLYTIDGVIANDAQIAAVQNGTENPVATNATPVIGAPAASAAQIPSQPGAGPLPPH